MIEAERKHIQRLLSEIRLRNGSAAVEQFPTLRHVDAKVREAKLMFRQIPEFGPDFVEEMDQDVDFEAMSRRVRLEALANYCDTALRLESTSVGRSKPTIYKCPDISHLTSILPGLEQPIKDRWLETQKCQHYKLYLSAVILMGGILEGLLLARASLDPAAANQATAAPKNRQGKILALHDWSLSSLIDVAAELGWLKTDRQRFSHALRESRNVVHPWQAVTSRSSFDRATCETCWQVLRASVADLRDSLPSSMHARPPAT